MREFSGTHLESRLRTIMRQALLASMHAAATSGFGQIHFQGAPVPR